MEGDVDFRISLPTLSKPTTQTAPDATLNFPTPDNTDPLPETRSPDLQTD